MIEYGGFMLILVLICARVGVCLVGDCLGDKMMYI
jgi:hypothetical protein